jgi:hypothetical protein
MTDKPLSGMTGAELETARAFWEAKVKLARGAASTGIALESLGETIVEIERRKAAITPPAPKAATCETCVFFSPGFRSLRDPFEIIMGEARAHGECRIRAHFTPNDDRPFPALHKDDWCGEHSPKEPSNAI